MILGSHKSHEIRYFFRTLHFGDSTMIGNGLRNPLESEVLFSVTKILIFFEVLIRALVSIANFVTMYKFL